MSSLRAPWWTGRAAAALVACALATVASERPAAAQDAFEIQVYESDTAAPREAALSLISEFDQRYESGEGFTPRRVSGSSVYWFDDTGDGECRIPAENISWRSFRRSANGPRTANGWQWRPSARR